MPPSQHPGSAQARPSLFAFLRHVQERDPDRPTRDEVEEVCGLIHTTEERERTSCGIGSFRPRWLQRVAIKEVYLAMFCTIAIALGMFGTYNAAVTSTLEKRFKLSSKQMGVVLSGNDISSTVFAILVGYFGNFGNRPRWVGLGVLSAALASFVAALPHLVYGQGTEAEGLLLLGMEYEEMINVTEAGAEGVVKEKS